MGESYLLSARITRALTKLLLGSLSVAVRVASMRLKFTVIRVQGFDSDDTLVAESDDFVVDASSGLGAFYIYPDSTGSAAAETIIANGYRTTDGHIRLPFSAGTTWRVVAIDNHENVSPITDIYDNMCGHESNIIDADVLTRDRLGIAASFFFVFCFN